MGNTERSNLIFLLKVANKLGGFRLQITVQVGKRFIKQQYRGTDDHGPGQGNPLLLTPGEKPGGNGDSVIPKPRTSPTPASLIKGCACCSGTQEDEGGGGAAAAAAAVAMVAAPAATTTAAGVARRERLRGFEQLY